MTTPSTICSNFILLFILTTVYTICLPFYAIFVGIILIASCCDNIDLDEELNGNNYVSKDKTIKKNKITFFMLWWCTFKELYRICKANFRSFTNPVIRVDNFGNTLGFLYLK